MYKQNVMSGSSIHINEATEGETIEMKIERVVNNNEPITDGAAIIFTERSEGVLAGYNVRTDRFEVAVDAMDKVSMTHAAKREEKRLERVKVMEDNHLKTSGEPTSIQGTKD